MTLEDSMPWLDCHSKLENKNKIVGDSYLHMQQQQQWLCVSASLPKPAASRIRSHQGREKRADEQWVGAPSPSYRRQSPLPSKLLTPNLPKPPKTSLQSPHPAPYFPNRSEVLILSILSMGYRFPFFGGSVITSLFRCCCSRLSNWIRGQESTPCWKPI